MLALYIPDFLSNRLWIAQLTKMCAIGYWWFHHRRGRCRLPRLTCNSGRNTCGQVSVQLNASRELDVFEASILLGLRALFACLGIIKTSVVDKRPKLE